MISKALSKLKRESVKGILWSSTINRIAPTLAKSKTREKLLSIFLSDKAKIYRNSILARGNSKKKMVFPRTASLSCLVQADLSETISTMLIT